MTQDIVRASEKSVLAHRARQSTPALLAVGGIAALFLFHSFLGFFATVIGLGWLVMRALAGKMTALEDAETQSNLLPIDPEKMSELKRRIYRLQSTDGCESRAERMIEQITRAQDRFRAFDRLLKGKLQATELTYSRYRGAAEQVFLSILDRLEDASELLESVAATQPTEAGEKLKEAEAKSEDAKPFRERLELVDQQFKKADLVLAANETGLTGLDRVNVSLTEMQTKATLAEIDYESALKQLEDLAKRAKNYSN